MFTRRFHFYSRVKGTALKKQGGTQGTGMYVDLNTWDVGVEAHGHYENGKTVISLFLNQGNEKESPLHLARNNEGLIPLLTISKSSGADPEIQISKELV